jgi:electron transport complex protein RnfD
VLSRDLLAFQRPLLTFARSTYERMLMVTLCALASIGQSAWFDQGRSLIVALAACGAALGVEFIRNRHKGRYFLQDGSSIVSALLLTLLLPNTINPLFAAAGACFAIAVVKHCFGGLGGNWFNPALGGWLFIRFSWPRSFDSAMQASPLSFISAWQGDNSGGLAASPVTILTKNGFGTQNGELITSFLNTHIFSIFKIELPAAYLDFFINPGRGLIADRGLLALLVGSVIMIAAMVSRSYLSAFYLAVLLALVRFAGAVPFGGPVGSGDMLFCLFSGGTLAVALFFVVEPCTGPKSATGRVFYVLVAALAAYFFRYVKAEGCGAIFAVVFVNVFSPLIRMIEEHFYYEGRVA